MNVPLDDKSKLYLKKFNTATQVLAVAFDFLPDDVCYGITGYGVSRPGIQN